MNTKEDKFMMCLKMLLDRNAKAIGQFDVFEEIEKNIKENDAKECFNYKHFTDCINSINPM